MRRLPLPPRLLRHEWGEKGLGLLFLIAVIVFAVGLGVRIWFEHRTFKQIISIPDLGIEMMPIPAGSFMMGSPESEEGRYGSEGPQHQVTISKPFWLGKYLVTQKQWVILMGAGSGTGSYLTVRPPEGVAIEGISWDEATSFCKVLTERERATGQLPPGYVYKLPTEAQWEYACRAGTTGPRYGSLDAIAWHNVKVESTPAALPTIGIRTIPASSTIPVPHISPLRVGQKQPNAWGLYDMFGISTQWCFDRFGLYSADAVIDPHGPDVGTFHVIRGAHSWNRNDREFRAAIRFSGDVNVYGAAGFRVALCPTQ